MSNGRCHLSRAAVVKAAASAQPGHANIDPIEETESDICAQRLRAVHVLRASDCGANARASMWPAAQVTGRGGRISRYWARTDVPHRHHAAGRCALRAAGSPCPAGGGRYRNTQPQKEYNKPSKFKMFAFQPQECCCAPQPAALLWPGRVAAGRPPPTSWAPPSRRRVASATGTSALLTRR